MVPAKVTVGQPVPQPRFPFYHANGHGGRRKLAPFLPRRYEEVLRRARPQINALEHLGVLHVEQALGEEPGCRQGQFQNLRITAKVLVDSTTGV